MRQYAGQQLQNGDRQGMGRSLHAVHLREIGAEDLLPGERHLYGDPKNVALANEVQTLFRGRRFAVSYSTLGWWTMGTYALYAAICMTVATVAVLSALLYELFLAPGLRPRGPASI